MAPSSNRSLGGRANPMAKRVAYPDRIEMLGKIACRDNFTEMHALKHHQATYEKFHATRPSLRAGAISSPRSRPPRSPTAASSDVWKHAAEVMHFQGRPPITAHLLRRRPRPHARRTVSTPRVRPAGASWHLDRSRRDGASNAIRRVAE
jgi:hypothetical protein